MCINYRLKGYVGYAWTWLGNETTDCALHKGNAVCIVSESFRGIYQHHVSRPNKIDSLFLRNVLELYFLPSYPAVFLLTVIYKVSGV